ncbi:MAG: 23S rRNA (guanosine(2251)-2'-O)-methyltransferase RlmB [Aquificaceae bacterium]|nr:MAG: 23S rRNA (guanosine(2251)-2'-O)-methyltransferase RlmB [Aquificaceae bacterium]
MEKGKNERGFVIWGRNPIIEALRANRSLEKIYIAHDSKPPKELLTLAKKRGVKVQRIPRKKVEELAKTKKTQGVVALLSPIEYCSEEELFRETIEKKGFFVVLDHITDPQNVGNIIRTTELFGGVGVLLPKDRSSPINETVVKASSGAIFHLKVAKVPSLQRALRTFKKIGGWVVAVETGGKDIREIDFPFPLAVVVGAEGEGVSKSVLEISDIVATIPTVGKVPSLNVGSATAIALWEVFKQQPK